MGHVKKLRFAAIMAGGLIAAGGTGVAMAQGGVSANLALSGTIFDMSVTEMSGDTASLFVGSEKAGDGTAGVSKLKFGDATARDVCMSTYVGDIPGFGPATFLMMVDGENFSAQNLLIGAKTINGAITMERPQIGIDASTVDGRAGGGDWGLAATRMIVSDQRLQATSVAADSLSIAGAKISIVSGADGGC